MSLTERKEGQKVVGGTPGRSKTDDGPGFLLRCCKVKNYVVVNRHIDR